VAIIREIITAVDSDIVLLHLKPLVQNSYSIDDSNLPKKHDVHLELYFLFM